MSDMVFKKVDYTLGNLVAYVEQGDIGLPELQRPFVWPVVKVRDLFDSLYHGYPIGYFLFWENGLQDHGHSIAQKQDKQSPKLLVVDGQQRITSLYAVIKGQDVLDRHNEPMRIGIAFRPKDGKFEVTNAAIKRDPEWIPDISLLWAKDNKRVVRDFFDRLIKEEELPEEEENRLDAAIDRLKNLVYFPLVALELSSSLDEESVADIFVRINSKGTPLNQANFILTLMSVFWEDGRKALENFCEQSRKVQPIGKPSPYNPLFQPIPDRLLRVGIGLGFRRARLADAYAILRGRDLETREFSPQKREQNFRILQQAQTFSLDLTNWHEFVKVVRQAGYRRKNLISSEYALLYTYTVFLIGKRDFQVPLRDLRNIIAQWFFMVSLTGRYTDSPESRMEQDLADFRGLSTAEEFISLLQRKINNEFTPDFWNISLPSNLATASRRNTAFLAYRASLVLLDAKAFFSELKVSDLLDPSITPRKPAAELHHLFPKAYLAKLGIEDRRNVDQVANLAVADWVDNIEIGDRPPFEYMPNFITKIRKENRSLDEIEQMCFWHGLPEGWEHMPYPDFLEERRKKMAQIIKEGFGKIAGVS
ncbi:MAG TPA: DUF262 domain-containing protein [Firmicutes bacterium]|nr:DUF262 domain-containing protein [Candidatus Fermentithermobacillaceae bacterium]